ncbi:hypothetical protein HJFPF1_07789 [Paramyrothecium foliicola]|nr:hypothetical protein HJFPF1_07789 [Paramyrothecium foliicola]
MVDLPNLQSRPSDTQPITTLRDRCPRRIYNNESSALQDLLYDTKLKLEQISGNAPTKMDPHAGHQGGHSSSSSSHHGYDIKGHGGDPGVLDGLLPRIETRGQSRGGRSKYDDKSKRGSKR